MSQPKCACGELIQGCCRSSWVSIPVDCCYCLEKITWSRPPDLWDLSPTVATPTIYLNARAQLAAALDPEPKHVTRAREAIERPKAEQPIEATPPETSAWQWIQYHAEPRPLDQYAARLAAPLSRTHLLIEKKDP